MIYLFAIQKVNGTKTITVLDEVKTFESDEHVRDYCRAKDGTGNNEVLAHYLESDLPLTKFQLARRLMQYPYFHKLVYEPKKAKDMPIMRQV